MTTSQPPSSLFTDRVGAGQALARRLEAYSWKSADRHLSDVVLFSISNGGGGGGGAIIVAAEIARQLKVPLDVCVVKKLYAKVKVPARNGRSGRVPIGAVSENGAIFLVNPTRLYSASLALTNEGLAALIAEAREEVEKTIQRRGGGGRPSSRDDLHGKTAIVVDDVLRTGFTARAALRSLRARDPARIVLAVPIASGRSIAALRSNPPSSFPFDEIVCLHTRNDEALLPAAHWYEEEAATVALASGEASATI
jgi:putative phosphoribosyl transferase